MAGDDQRCQSYGAAPGSPSYVQCRMAADQQRQAAIAQLAGNMRAQEIQRNEQFQRDQRAYQSYPRPAVSCTTMAMGGGMSSTNCQ